MQEQGMREKMQRQRGMENERNENVDIPLDKVVTASPPCPTQERRPFNVGATFQQCHD